MAADPDPPVASDPDNRPEEPSSSVSLLLVVAVIALGVLVGVIFYGYLEKPGWVGAADKEFWDYLELLIVPAALALVVFWLNRAQSARDREAEDAQQERERKAEEERRERERIAQAAQRERELEVENQRAQDGALQAYLDQMSQLLIEQELRRASPGDSLSTVARARTLTVLSRLNGDRKASVLEFLYEANLIGKIDPDPDDPFEDMSAWAQFPAAFEMRGANLTEANLRGADLSGADLHGADLDQADLQYALLWRAKLYCSSLVRAKLINARMENARLGHADLTKADLRLVDLNGADLTKANLSHANFKGVLGTLEPSFEEKADLEPGERYQATLHGTTLNDADLTGANLTGASLTGANLSGAILSGAILSDAILREADLRGAYLIDTMLDADLSGADLSGATVDLEELDRHANLESATMPDGQKYEEWLKSKDSGENGESSGPS